MPYSSVLDTPDDGGDFLMGENITVFDTLAPLTDIEPDDGETEYPDTLLVAYEYVPFVRENEYDVPVIAPESTLLLRLTYHVVPDGRPDSVKVTVYLTSSHANLKTKPTDLAHLQYAQWSPNICNPRVSLDMPEIP